MSQLSVTFIDVGWGDSILLEYIPNAGMARYALIDCNDTNISRSSYLFVKRFFERNNVTLNDGRNRYFDFVMLTHGHNDHASGIQSMMSNFPTDWFWYPKSVEFGGFAKVVRYANRYQQKVNRHQAIDQTKVLDDFGDVSLRALWPPYNPNAPHDPNNENNNSIVLELTLGQVRFILTGDCEAENWQNIINANPNLNAPALFQSPHHGAENGVFDRGNNTPWIDVLEGLPHPPLVAMSSHIVPHNHPSPTVVDELVRRIGPPVRTDQQYHLTISTDGTLNPDGSPNIEAKYTKA